MCKICMHTRAHAEGYDYGYNLWSRASFSKLKAGGQLFHNHRVIEREGAAR